MIATPVSIQRMLCSTMACVLLGHTSPPSYRAHDALGGPVHADSTPLSTITTDTGTLAPGNRDFSSFTDPFACLYAVDIASQELRRSGVVQENHFARFLSDSAMFAEALPAGAVSVAQACAAKFTVEKTAPDRLMDLFELQLMTGKDDIAHAALERSLSLTKDTMDRVRVLWEAIDKYLGAEPTRLAAAESTIARVDALGTHWQAVRVSTHMKLLVLAMKRHNKQYMQREAERIIALGQEVPTKEIMIDYRPFWNAYTALGEIAYVDHPDSLTAVMTRAKQDLSRFPSGMPVPNASPFGPISEFTGKVDINPHPLGLDFKTISVEKLQEYLVPVAHAVNWAKEHANKALPPLVATYWFPKPPGSWPPGNGKRSLVLYGGDDCGARGYGFPVDFGSHIVYKNPELDGNYALNNNKCLALSQWIKQYGSRLSITMVVQTQGFVARNVLHPAAEADSLRWFFLDHLRLPVTLGVVVDSVWKLPVVNGVADGRQFQIDTNYYEKKVKQDIFGQFTSSTLALYYDEHGTLQYAGVFDWRNLQRLIDLSMGAPGMFPFEGENPN